MRTSMLHHTLLRTVIYTIGHILIAICCIIFITGTDLRLATIDAIVEPLINSLWYFALDYLWNINSKRKLLRHES